MSELLQHPRLRGILEDIADLKSYDEISFNGRPWHKAALEELNKMVKTITETTLYRAAGETLPHITIRTKPGNFLELQGVYLDRILILGPEFPSSLSEPTSLSSVDDLHKIARVLLHWKCLILVLPRIRLQALFDATILNLDGSTIPFSQTFPIRYPTSRYQAHPFGPHQRTN